MSLTVTARAAQKIRSSVMPDDGQMRTLRVAARRAADGSIEYAMGFDQATEADTRVAAEEVTVVIAPQSLPLLDGATLDFVELEPGEFQFIFLNPNDPHFVPPRES